MYELIEKNSTYFENLENSIDFLDKENDIIETLNNKNIIIVSGILGINKASIIKDIVDNNYGEEDIFYFNKELDFSNKIQNIQDLDELYTNEGIIILENFLNISKISLFIKEKFKEGNKIILIGNGIKFKGVEEIEILPKINFLDFYGNEKIYDFLTNKIILKDIYVKNKLKNYDLLIHIINILALNIELISIREINKILNENGTKVSHITTIEYLDYILESKLIKKVYRYDMKLKNLSSGKSRYLFTSTNIREILLKNFLDKSIVNENLVYQRLLEIGKTEVYTGKNGTFNFSFLSKNLIVHICPHLEKNEVKKEINKLLKVPGNYEKYFIVNSIKDIGIRKSTYLPLKVVEIEEFLENTKL